MSRNDLVPFIRRCARRLAPLSRSGDSGGFTLIELLVVLAILGLLIGLVAPAAMRELGSSKHKVAEAAVGRLVPILDMYKVDTGNYPTSDQGLEALYTRPAGVAGWNGPYVTDDQSLKDPWGRPYIYKIPSERPNHPFDIISFGAEGKPGGAGEDAEIINR